MDFKSLIGGATFFALGVSVCIGAYALGVGRLNRPGTGLIFFLAGSVVALLSVADIVKGLLSRKEGIRELLSVWQGVYWRRAALILFGTLIYALLLNAAGFLVLTPFYVGFCMRILSRQKWWITGVAVVLSTLTFYLLSYSFNLPISPLPAFLNL